MSSRPAATGSRVGRAEDSNAVRRAIQLSSGRALAKTARAPETYAAAIDDPERTS
jgi:hypothetical protein